MNIMVFDVPAENRGALSILNDFYDEVKLYNDEKINWIFVVSKPQLQETENIKVLRFPWVKKSWAHRFLFDNFVAAKLIKKYKIDKVLSFQNVIIPRTKVPQTLYVHQPLPFVSYKFTLKENKIFWVYQNVIGKKIINSIKRANKVIVQTEWMKQSCKDKSGVKSEKIDVVSPRVNVEIKDFFKPTVDSLSTFFYPAGASTYKNHKIIIDTCKNLKNENIIDYKVIFTLKGNENEHIMKLYKEVKDNNLPIAFVGSLSREKVFDLYTNSILLFPSYIETYGLPLLEARLHRGIILASDSPFSKEILNNYENAYFFNPFNSEELLLLMKGILQFKVDYINVEEQNNLKINKGETKLINKLI
ncbi:glycosyltransferase [Peribacillus frigoritolerans]|uniref:glycosyltransferase n=1 Tax=Peribacillus frigoritolerans TaxID=450367 RepID=UPI003D02196F